MRSGSKVAEPPVGHAPEPAIAVENLSVVYRLRSERPTLRSLVRGLTSNNGSMREIHALEDVSFDVPRGSVLGIIGKNGAGKSTLLRAIAGLLPPAEGRITVRGEVTPLLTLGVGFNRELTGRENVVLGALAAGLTETEAKNRFDDIAAFAELGEFIEYPIRSYSSGMSARLGFAVAAHLDPEILLIDETLAVGDGAFKDKCRTKMEELCGEGRTVLLVTHGLGTVLEMASKCLWLHEGRLMRHGSPLETVEAYMRFARIQRSQAIDDAAWGEDG